MERGERLKYIRKSLGLTQAQLAEKIGMSRSNIASFESGVIKKMSYDFMENIAVAFDISMEELSQKLGNDPEPSMGTGVRYLLSEIQERVNLMDTVEIPILGGVPAGNPSLSEEAKEGYVIVPKSELGAKAVGGMFALNVKGESLSGDDIADGDFVIVEPGTEILDGKIYICGLENEVVARHVYKEADKLVLVSSNSHYSKLKPDEIKIMGRVILSGRWNKH